MRERPVIAAIVTVTLGLCQAAFGCAVEERGVPEGKLARVGDVVLGPQDLAATRAQLDAYGQLRFVGGEGDRQLLHALVTAELLAQAAVEHGLGDDPRVQFALEEEIASVFASSELERRVPFEEIAADTEALRAYYDAHPQEFTIPQKRSMQGVRFESFEAAEGALAELQAGQAQLEDFGEVFATPKQDRDDVEFATFHPFLFAKGLQEGDWLEHPVLLAETILVGRVLEIEPAHPEPFDDPAVQERLVNAVRKPLLEQAKQELLEELQAQQGDRPPD